MSPFILLVRDEKWPLKRRFAISRGSKTDAHVVTVEISAGDATGRAECVPYARYGESVESVKQAIWKCESAVSNGLSRMELQELMPPGAARNALDCALWDLEARLSRKSAAAMASLPPPEPVMTAYTISLSSADEMAAMAVHAGHHRLLKLKLGAEHGDADRLKAVRTARPDARLIVDANEGWNMDVLPALLDACTTASVELVEQPLPADDDHFLEDIESSVLICADESAHDRQGLDTLKKRYGALNIKLDKTGGLTEALLLAEAAGTAGMRIMVGCMVATSLSMAPALLLAHYADYIDLDGPLLLEHDRTPGLTYQGDRVYPSSPELWG